MKRLKLYLAIIFIFGLSLGFFVASCGGGGGGSASPTPVKADDNPVTNGLKLTTTVVSFDPLADGDLQQQYGNANNHWKAFPIDGLSESNCALSVLVKDNANSIYPSGRAHMPVYSYDTRIESGMLYIRYKQTSSGEPQYFYPGVSEFVVTIIK